MKKLHEEYGPVVRLGPNLLDIDYPELSRVVYNTDGKWIKVMSRKRTWFLANSEQSDFFKIISPVINGKIAYHIFSQVDNALHAQLKRPVVRYYSIPSIRAMEPHMDRVIEDFCDHLKDRFVETGKTCQLGDWLTYCKAWFRSSVA